MVLGKSSPVSSWCYDFFVPFLIVKEHCGGRGQNEPCRKRGSPKDLKSQTLGPALDRKFPSNPFVATGERLGEFLVPGLWAAQGDNRKENTKLLRHWSSPVRIKGEVWGGIRWLLSMKYQGRGGIQKPPGALSRPPPPVSLRLHAFIGWRRAFVGLLRPLHPSTSSAVFMPSSWSPCPSLGDMCCLNHCVNLSAWLPPYHCASEFWTG